MHKLISEGLTFDDVLLIPQKSDVLPGKVDLTTMLTKTISLKAPLISAAMDTVTESQMAIAIARQGGIGIIHSGLSIREQAIEVDKVKRSEHGVITDPFSLSPNHYVYEADDLMSKYRISGVPITENGKLAGIITNRDIRFETDHSKKIYEVMTRENLITAPEGTTLEQAQKILAKHKIEKLPIVDEKFNLKGLITIKDIEKTIKYPGAAKDETGRLLVGAAVNAGGDYIERTDELVKAKVDVVVIGTSIDTSMSMAKYVAQLKKNFSGLQVIAGNVATADCAIDLIEAGADAIKVGIGPGTISTTRIVTGVGIPQITAIYDCAEAAKKYGVPVIADGGMKYSGDLTKAIAAGANSCMLGRAFAGCQESPGRIELFQGRKYKVYRGTRILNSAPGDEYKPDGKHVPEGVEGRVAYKGQLSDTVFHLLGGLRAGMSYCGCETIGALRERGRFIKITGAGQRESHPHDIQITKESPNYSIEY